MAVLWLYFQLNIDIHYAFNGKRQRILSRFKLQQKL